MQTQFSPKTRQYDDEDSNDYIDIKQNWFKDQKDRFANREKRPKRELDQDRMDATFTNFSNVILPKKRSTEVPSKRSNGVLAFRFKGHFIDAICFFRERFQDIELFIQVLLREIGLLQ